MSLINERFRELEVQINIIFSLYGVDLDIQQLQEYLFLEFDQIYSNIEIEDYLIVNAKEKQDDEYQNPNFTIDWIDLIR